MEAIELIRTLENQWLTIFAILAWLVYKSGVFQRIAGVEMAERQQLSKEHQRLVDNMRMAIASLELRVTGEREACDERYESARLEYERRLVEVRDKCDREIEVVRAEVASLIRGAATSRHLIGNLAQYIYLLRRELDKAGISIPEFTGWGQFFTDGGDMATALSHILGESGPREGE